MEDARPNHNSSASPSSPSSLKDKLKSSLCLSCCLPTNHQPQTVDSHHKSVKSSCSMPGARAAHSLPEIKDRLVSHLRGRRQSSQFRYDPLSYSLNFDQGVDDNDADLNQFRNFTARLPQTPPREAEPAPVDSVEVPVVRS